MTVDTDLRDYFGQGTALWMDVSEELREATVLMDGPDAPMLSSIPRTAEEFAAGRRMVIEAVAPIQAASYPKLTPDRARSITIPGPAGELRMLTVLPKDGDVSGVMLHVHGGGWWCGSPEMNLASLALRADTHRLAVASVDYRLAPEHRYPAAVDDCEVAALWWIDYCRRELGAKRFLVAGESAGAHLSLVTALRMRRRHGFRFDGGVFTYGMYDFCNGLPSRSRVDGRNLLQDSRMCAFYADNFLPEGTNRADGGLSPLYAELGNDLPPALFSVGTLDPFLDDSLLMHTHWQLAGNRSWLVAYRGAMHGFDMFHTADARHLRGVEDSFMRACLDGTL